ncbi:MAG: hypothetical protein HZC14_01900 [Candidatus Niyogibacteria bacterium]|nr:hypothetical protein [Candidatus Niyogibacteria bacterium]
MRTIKYIAVSFLLMPLLVSAQTPLTLPSPGLTPDSPFYFLDRVGEALQEFFTFNPAAKARLQLEFAAERISEIKTLLDTRGVTAKGLDVAETSLKDNLAKAADILKSEKDKGQDVSALAKDLGNSADAEKAALRQTFQDEKQSLKDKEKDLKTRINDAKRAGDIAQVDALTKELNDVKGQKELLKDKEGKGHDDLDEESEKIAEHMDKKDEAGRAIQKAENAKAELINEASIQGIVIPEEVFVKFDNLLAQAKELVDKENYQGAKELAKAAKKGLERASEAVGELKDAQDKEDELGQKQAEREHEAKKQDNERAREEAKQAAEQLNKEKEHAVEATKKAEELLREAGKGDENSD